MGAAVSRPPFFRESCRNRKPLLAAGWVGETRGRKACSRANGSEVNPRGQGPRGYGIAARRLPAFDARDAGGVTPLKYR